MSISETIQSATQRFAAAGIDSGNLDAELLAAHVFKKDRAWVLSHSADTLADAQKLRYDDLVEKRCSRIPLAYLVGHKEFFGHEFLVTKKVLVPRPETELLVEQVLDYLKNAPNARSLLDLGTGSGAIACSVASSAPQLTRIVAVDVSTAALEVAKQNGSRLGLADRIQFKRMHMGRMQTLKGPFDVIVSNPPYLSEKEYATARKECPEIGYEPQIAFIGGKDGLTFITLAIRVSRKLLSKSGALFLEIGATQGDAVAKLVATHLPNYSTAIISDLSGHPRVVRITPKVASTS